MLLFLGVPCMGKAVLYAVLAQDGTHGMICVCLCLPYLLYEDGGPFLFSKDGAAVDV